MAFFGKPRICEVLQLLPKWDYYSDIGIHISGQLNV